MGHPWTPLFSKLQCPEEHLSSKGKQGSHLSLPTVISQPCFICISFQRNFRRTQKKRRRQLLYALARGRVYTVFCREPSRVLSPGQHQEGGMRGNPELQYTQPVLQRRALCSQSRAPRLGLLVDICVKMRSPGAGNQIAFRTLFLWLSVKWIGFVKQ